jgi:hypothetical protein
MTLTTRTQMRRCGKPFPSAGEAMNSKRGRGGGFRAERCLLCPGWHLRRIPAGVKTMKPAAKPAAKKDAATAPDTFSGAVCEQIDLRDGDDTGAVLVRLCQRCGSTRNLHRHHRRLKGSGGTSRAHAHCACNGVVVCFRCHGEIHTGDRRGAVAEGWIVPQDVDEPGSVGVMRFAAAEGGATQWPSCTGEWLETAPEAMEAA